MLFIVLLVTKYLILEMVVEGRFSKLDYNSDCLLSEKLFFTIKKNY